MGFAEIFVGLSAWSLILLIAGIICLVAEMFQPGFGVFGGVGLALLLLDVIISARSFAHGLLLGGVLLMILLVLFIIFLWLSSSGKLPKKLILFSKEDVASGYIAADFSRFLGMSGVTATQLRPAGIVRVEDENLDVVSEGEFIEKDVAVRIKTVEGNRIVVERE